MQIYTHYIFAQTRVLFINLKNVLGGEIVPVLIKHNNLGCGCLAELLKSIN